ncbi:MAG: NAD(P)-binding domain-containing protein [Prevotella sp.]|nr:NAD(P)-binding domain-containing protein [Bacteroides sp.]MCM1366905.1 NAD(P)-binding domain-containing protein [Prevotella sp.]MCM1437450.1 NAD(P)-binding domain-containing protein [Prevotella sp.]
MTPLGQIAVIGGGSWATALAKLLMGNCDRLVWYIRRPDRIEDFIKYRHNPVYLSDVSFDVHRIDFYSDINEVCRKADTLVIAVPSPYFKSEADKITVDISGKNIISAVKGIVSDENLIVTDYFKKNFGCKDENLLVIGGPCHAEEVALARLSYLTIGCHDREKSRLFASMLAGKRMKTIISTDVEGIEYAAVLKNVYAIAGGIVSGLQAGDNFLAMLVSNAIREMGRFVAKQSPMPDRDICKSAYLGDLLVTAYSAFSRNHNLGLLIGKGYSVKAAMLEMEQVAEGYYGTKCIYELNREAKVDMPILNAVYDILYRGISAKRGIDTVTDTFE